MDFKDPVVLSGAKISRDPEFGMKLDITLDKTLGRPRYIETSMEDMHVDNIIESTDWLEATSARRECFMSDNGGLSYTYGKGRGVRTYTSIPYNGLVKEVLNKVNEQMKSMGYMEMNGCFLNYYEDERQHLGWHADDFINMDHEAPVVVISFGEPREIWWREIGVTGKTPPERIQLLENGSMFIMPPGFQHTHEHRIPKGGRTMGPRVSLTFRRFDYSDPELVT